MIETFTLQLIMSFVVGFVWITALSILAERSGTRLGGAVAGVPATMVIALFFIGLTQSAAIAVQATTIVPLALVGNLLFAIVYIATAHLGLSASLALALLGWSLTAVGVRTINTGFWQACVVFLVLLFLTYFILEKMMRVEAADGKPIAYGIREITLRGLIGGGVIFLTVWGARIGGPLFGGVLATFPALMMALILIAHLRNGPRFTAHLLKHLALGGLVNVLVFVAVFRYSVNYGLVLGTILAFVVSTANTYGMYMFLNKRIA